MNPTAASAILATVGITPPAAVAAEPLPCGSDFMTLLTAAIAPPAAVAVLNSAGGSAAASAESVSAVRAEPDADEPLPDGMESVAALAFLASMMPVEAPRPLPTPDAANAGNGGVAIASTHGTPAKSPTPVTAAPALPAQPGAVGTQEPVQGMATEQQRGMTVAAAIAAAATTDSAAAAAASASPPASPPVLAADPAAAEAMADDAAISLHKLLGTAVPKSGSPRAVAESAGRPNQAVATEVEVEPESTVFALTRTLEAVTTRLSMPAGSGTVAEGTISQPSAYQSLQTQQHDSSVAPTRADGTDQAPVRSPVGTPRWADEVGSRLVLMSLRGQQEGSLTLSPDHLGPLEVRISVSQDSTNVWFGAQHADTRAALTEALPRLRELLAATGISLGHAGVSHDMPRQDARNAEAFAAAGSGAESGEPAAVEVVAPAVRRIRSALRAAWA
jgi:flagellar hook-length control protein FliK